MNMNMNMNVHHVTVKADGREPQLAMLEQNLREVFLVLLHKGGLADQRGWSPVVYFDEGARFMWSDPVYVVGSRFDRVLQPRF